MAPVDFNHNKVEPGKVSVKFASHSQPQVFPFVHKDSKHIVVANPQKDGSTKFQRISHTQPHIERVEVLEHPTKLDTTPLVDAAAHSLTPFDDDSGAMVHGLDFSSPDKKFLSSDENNSFRNKEIQIMDSPNGGKVVVKPFNDSHPISGARREATFSGLARHFFGLGNNVPMVAAIAHPQTGQEHAVIQHLDGKHVSEDDPQLTSMAATGDLDKLGAMDYITNHGDRHPYNSMLGEDGQLKLIDNESAFDPGIYNHQFQEPSYLQAQDPNRQIHPNTMQWIRSLNPRELSSQMRQYGMPRRYVKQAVDRLIHLQSKPDGTPASQFYSDPSIMVQ